MTFMQVVLLLNVVGLCVLLPSRFGPAFAHAGRITLFLITALALQVHIRKFNILRSEINLKYFSGP